MSDQNLDLQPDALNPPSRTTTADEKSWLNSPLLAAE